MNASNPVTDTFSRQGGCWIVLVALGALPIGIDGPPSILVPTVMIELWPHVSAVLWSVPVATSNQSVRPWGSWTTPRSRFFWCYGPYGSALLCLFSLLGCLHDNGRQGCSFFDESSHGAQERSEMDVVLLNHVEIGR